MPNLYIIAGCDGAGKTTAASTILPEILHCREFVNADNIAAGLSPFNAESVALDAGKIMLKRIEDLMLEEVDFAFETTLATKSYVPLIKKAQDSGYTVILLYFLIHSPDCGIQRVAGRTEKGGHGVSSEVIVRRFINSFQNFTKLYIALCDQWLAVDNSGISPRIANDDLFGISYGVLNDTLQRRPQPFDMETFSRKILEGMRIAVKKLVTAAAANKESLIIDNGDGTWNPVPATDLLGSV